MQVARGTLPVDPGTATIVDLRDALLERASYYLLVGGGNYMSEVAWRLGSLRGGAPSTTCFTVLGNRTFVTWACPPAAREISATATPAPTPVACRKTPPPKADIAPPEFGDEGFFDEVHARFPSARNRSLSSMRDRHACVLTLSLCQRLRLRCSSLPPA